MVDKPHCLDARLFNEKLVGIEMQKVKMLLTKPSYVGFVVLELSKLHMLKYALPTYHPIITASLSYFSLNIHRHQSHEIIHVLDRFHYDIIKARYGEKAHLLFTDTDSLMYHIETADVYKDMVDMKDHFDLSNYEPTNPYYEPGFATNKAVVGKMKDEVAGNPIAEFVGLRPKMDSFEAVKINPDGTKERYDKYRAKGIQRAAAERFLHQQ